MNTQVGVVRRVRTDQTGTVNAEFVVLLIVVVTALGFDFTNGFHDTANAMATSIATGALKPKVAVTLSAILNLVGAFLSVEVAATVAKGIVNLGDTGGQALLIIVFAGLVGGILWNLLTWLLGIPSSSSHDRAEIEDAIAHLVHEHPDDDDITRVASRLAAGGWPLEAALAEKTPLVKALPPLLASIIGWLRAGYPQGVPENDYIPLIALLRRRLSDEEVREITAALVDQGDLPIGKPDIQMMITKVTNEIPLDVDVERVRAHLVAGGWAITDDTPNDHPH